MLFSQNNSGKQHFFSLFSVTLQIEKELFCGKSGRLCR